MLSELLLPLAAASASCAVGAWLARRTATNGALRTGPDTVRGSARRIAADRAAAEQRLMTNLAHELRTPLTGLIGFAELAAQRDLDKTRRLDLMQRAESSGRRLLQLVSDLRDHARVRRGELRCHAVDAEPRQVMQRIADLTRRAAECKGLLFALHVDESVPTRARFDPDRTAQVLMALLDNAIRFTRRGHVALTCEVVADSTPNETDTLTLRFAVHDTGDGMPPQLRSELTAPARPGTGRLDQDDVLHGTLSSEQVRTGQADDGFDRRHGGIGLGLRLAVGITRQLGGSLHVRSSAANDGSTLSVDLPVGLCAPASHVAAPDPVLPGVRPGQVVHPPAEARPPAGRTAPIPTGTAPSEARPTALARRAPATSRREPLHARALVATADRDERMSVGHALEAEGLFVEEAPSDAWRQLADGHDIVVLSGVERDGLTRDEARSWQPRAHENPPVLIALVPRATWSAALRDELLDDGFAAALPTPLDREQVSSTLHDLLAGCPH